MYRKPLHKEKLRETATCQDEISTLHDSHQLQELTQPLTHDSSVTSSSCIHFEKNITQQFWNNIKLPLRVEWMKNKISHSLPFWIQTLYGMISPPPIMKTETETRSFPKKILLFNYLRSIGFNGQGSTPRGELTQWTDLVMALALQNHHVYYVHDFEELVNQVLPEHSIESFHLIFTDYSSLHMYLSEKLGFIHQLGRELNSRPQKHQQLSKCRLRILDSFGTHQKYNSMNAADVSDRSSSSWCCWNLNLKQILTLQPLKIPDPVNQFLGIAIPFDMESILHRDMSRKKRQASSGKYRALIWAKEFKYFERVPSSYLKTISERFELVTTLTFNDFEKVRIKFPTVEFTNLGILTHSSYVKVLRESVIYVGLGEPYIGPSSLEALAYGNVIFNPRIKPFKLSDIGKPSDEIYTSQVPYLESIGAPNVITLRMMDTKSVARHVHDVELLLDENHGVIPPYIPSEFTVQAFFYRVYSIVNSYDFCD
ncbi:hypothetical protein C9374_004011 [Naegleria lovaniensis]|uniref:alpha-1,6-mannosyl-glycoprotein 6-beta-N-acetylglucosaminyltransferase n=1 Tax=Naegleria lovaniensis TaxID=51637 RepID=A0AA88H948_NAELO|nr:uncharacterized protein C9374_004011 [Naegleria lovaniensis]KAG2394247.1 hypothetical protein C9374_004011 [Naegleria lovaniensis]